MDRIYYEVVTVPPNTPATTPTVVSILLEDAELKEIDCRIPDGHCGLTGIRLLQSQQQIWPWANNSYFVGNDDKLNIPYDDQIQASGIVANAYNTDIFQHSFYLRFTITDLPLPGEEAPAEVAAPGSQSSTFVPEDDEFSVDNILGDDSGDETGQEPGQPPVEAPAPIAVVPVSFAGSKQKRPVKHKPLPQKEQKK